MPGIRICGDICTSQIYRYRHRSLFLACVCTIYIYIYMYIYVYVEAPITIKTLSWVLLRIHVAAAAAACGTRVPGSAIRHLLLTSLPWPLAAETCLSKGTGSALIFESCSRQASKNPRETVKESVEKHSINNIFEKSQ